MHPTRLSRAPCTVLGDKQRRQPESQPVGGEKHYRQRQEWAKWRLGGLGEGLCVDIRRPGKSSLEQRLAGREEATQVDNRKNSVQALDRQVQRA